jgi:glutaredoxin
MSTIKLYGADWCADCVRAKAFLNNNNVAFDFIDTDMNSDAAQIVEEINKGKRIIPTILIDGTAYTNPDNYELSAVLNLTSDMNDAHASSSAGCSIDDKSSCGIERDEMEVGDEGGY